MRCRPFCKRGHAGGTRGWLLRLGGVGLLGAGLLTVLIGQSSPPAPAVAAGTAAVSVAAAGTAAANDESPALRPW